MIDTTSASLRGVNPALPRKNLLVFDCDRDSFQGRIRWRRVGKCFSGFGIKGRGVERTGQHIAREDAQSALMGTDINESMELPVKVDQNGRLAMERKIFS